jgi:hypothetical protein
MRSCIPRPRAPGISAGCEIPTARAYAGPCLREVGPSAPFEIGDHRSGGRESGRRRGRACVRPLVGLKPIRITWQGV